MLDQNDALFTVTDLKQYTYCPRILYYQLCLPAIRPVTYKMQAGIDAHETERKRAARRGFYMTGSQDADATRRFDVAVISDTLLLSGLVDEVVGTPSELIPVDYKLAKKAGFHFKLQLAAYALLLEEAEGKPVKRGFLYLIPKKKAEEVRITAGLRRKVREAVADMQAIALQERMPPPTEWRQRCPDCEFRRFCNDV